MEENKKEIEVKSSVGQEQIHDMLFSRDLGWRELIYDLINTEQLDPWDIDIVILTDKYLVKIQNLEEADFVVSSKVLLAAALLLRIKSEIILNKYIKSIDDILFGKKEVKKYEMERIELDEEIPELVPRSPLPRAKKVTLAELMESLSKAITTENRRIKKEVIKKNALRETSFSLPKRNFNIKDKIKEIFDSITSHFDNNFEKKKIAFTELIGTNKEERIISFSPLLHLENQKKLWLQQEGHFEEIYIWLKEVYFKHNPDPFEELRTEIEEEIKEFDDEKKQRIEKVNEDFENPLGAMFD